MQTYRVLKQIIICGNSPDEPNVLWEGSEISSLSQKYPRTNDRRTDDLSPTFSCSDFSQRVWFERQEGEAWVRCDDPRPVEYGRRRR